MEKYRALIFDLDGTLAESKQPITTAMAELLTQLMKHSVVAVMSGGSWKQFETQFIASFPPQTDFSHLYIFPSNAAQCYVYKDAEWRTAYDNQLEQEERTYIQEVITATLKETGFLQPTQVWGLQIEDRGGQISFSPLGQQAPLDAKKAWRAAHDTERMHMRDMLAAKLSNYSVRTGGETTIDITRKGLTKAYGLQKLSELTDTPISEMIYVGDALEEGGNDSVVKETGVQTYEVLNPQDTAVFIKQAISK